MKIIVAEHLGMCFGVRDAIAQAQQLAGQAPLTVLGELVHNPIVREELRSRGIEEQSSVPANASQRVMITAHGASDTRRRELQQRGFDIADGTCPLVRHAHTQLRRLVSAGYFPVVIGVPNHVEVRGLTEDFAGAIVINCAADVLKLPHTSRFGVISQTTQPIARVRALVETIRAARPEAEVRFVDTVCKPTKDRQHALKQLLELTDTIVVIGGRHSNNTRELVQTCRAAGRRAIHMERAEEIGADDLQNARIVGVTAGTSTLPETIAAVIERLQQISRNAPQPTTNK